MVVPEGGDALFPVSIDENAERLLFDWRKVGPGGETLQEIFLYDAGLHYNNGQQGQSQQFKGRVSHFPAELKHGNSAIVIRNAKLSDSGIYTCYFPPLQPTQKFYFELYVAATPKPRVMILTATADWALLQCEVPGASLNTKAEWQSGDGNRLKAEEERIYVHVCEKESENCYSTGAMVIVGITSFVLAAVILAAALSLLVRGKCIKINKEGTERVKEGAEVPILQRKPRTSEGPRSHSCQHCDKSFATSGYLLIHQRVHSGEKPYSCDQCGKAFKQKCHLNRHNISHTGEKPHICGQCGKAFSLADDLRAHYGIHTGEKPYSCDQCGAAFAKKSHLKTHNYIHTGEKPFSCDQCEKSFTTSSDLKKHRRIHSGEKPHSCNQCGKAFPRICALNRHQRTHTGEKPYWCDLCGKTFARAYILQVHRRLHTGEKPYWCEQCEKTFITSGALSAHQRIHTEPI
ncbi:hypothetical protein JOQ06_014704 [Pogonophryne albipinna]|uniref:Uncharacterized protein n=1 Tax=Pogonophryne albipinna TaxID=1090488 RepID=A0AAD6ALN3_9TELE|nr:hypothetical protein JOQ06_014704 [Pogonophryne albipinna]